MKKLLFIIFLISFNFTFSQHRLQPTETEVLVVFKVTDEFSKPYPGALVRLENKLNSLQLGDSSNEQGEVEMLLKKGSSFNLTVEATGKSYSFGQFDISDQPGLLTMEEMLQVKTASITNLNIQFLPNKADLFEAAKAEVDKLYDQLVKNPNMRIEIAGHTDNIGSEEQNQILSQKRTNAIRDYLIKKGIAARRIVAKGYGESKPIASNDTDEGRAHNRRIEVKVL